MMLLENTLPSSQSMLTALGINPDSLKHSQISHFQKAQYRAVINWLSKYKPTIGASNLEKVRGYLDACYHLFEIAAWENVYKILCTKLNVPNNEELGDQLFFWGYYLEQIALYKQLLDKLDDRVNAICYKSLGSTYRILGNYVQADDYSSRAVNLFLKLEDKKNTAWVLHELGLMIADQGNSIEARLYYERSLKLFGELKYFKGVALVNNDIARWEAIHGNYVEAIKLFNISLTIYSDLEDKVGHAWTLYNFGRLLDDQGEHAKARLYVRMGLKFFRDLSNKNGVVWSLYSLSILMLNLRKNQSANICSIRALNMFRELGNKSGIAWSLHILGRSAFRLEQYKLSLESYYECLLIHRESENQVGIIYALEGFARLAAIQGQTDQAKRAANILGATEVFRKIINLPLPIPDRVDYERSVTVIRSQIDQATYTAAWTSGQTMSVEQSITVALEIRALLITDMNCCRGDTAVHPQAISRSSSSWLHSATPKLAYEYT